MSAFQQRKDSILASLSTPDTAYTDLSPKGSVDAGIRDLVDKVNSLEGLVTTSSCAGRVAIYVDGGSTFEQPGTANGHETATPRASSKGGGRWLFVSHDPLTHVTRIPDDDLFHTLGLNIADDCPAQATGSRLVHLKFEPMILHILCSSLKHAKQVLAAAMGSGFRESGISSINDDQSIIMSAVRTNGLAFDSIIGTAGQHDDTVHLTVSLAHIRMLLELSTSRFSANTSRTARFRDALLAAHSEAALSSNLKGDTDWEPADARRARKRAEGLQRQQQKQVEQRLDAATDASEPAVGQLFASQSA